MNSESLCAPGDQPEKEIEGERERKQDTGTKALMEQMCFIQHCVGIYTVLQDSYFQQRYYHMVHKQEKGTYHHIEKLMKEMPGFLSPGRGLALLLIPEYSGINKEQRLPDRSKTAHRTPPVKCFLTMA